MPDPNTQMREVVNDISVTYDMTENTSNYGVLQCVESTGKLSFTYIPFLDANGKEIESKYLCLKGTTTRESQKRESKRESTKRESITKASIKVPKEGKFNTKTKRRNKRPKPA
jgi:hypothetical protein